MAMLGVGKGNGVGGGSVQEQNLQTQDCGPQANKDLVRCCGDTFSLSEGSWHTSCIPGTTFVSKKLMD